MLEIVTTVEKLYTVNSIEFRKALEFFRSIWQSCEFDRLLWEYPKAVEFVITVEDFALHFELALYFCLVTGYFFQK